MINLFLILLVSFTALPSFAQCSSLSKRYTGTFTPDENFSKLSYKVLTKKNGFKITVNKRSFHEPVENDCGALSFQLPIYLIKSENPNISPQTQLTEFICNGSLLKKSIQATCAGKLNVLFTENGVVGIKDIDVAGELLLNAR